MSKDLQQALRLIRKNPGFSLAVITVMAFSIGACTAIFSVGKAVLYTRLPYISPDRLVILWHTVAGGGARVVGMSPHDYTIYRDTARSFESVAAITSRGYNLSTASEPVRVTCGRVTDTLFPTLGIAPFRGRWFDRSDDRDNANHVILISHDSWKARYGGDEEIVGKSISLDLVPHTVVGIMPKSFNFPPEGVQGLAQSECWVPAGFSPAEMATPGFNFVVFGRLKPGVTLAQAKDDAAGAAKRVLESYPAEVRKAVALTSRVVPLNEQVTARSRIALLVFASSVGLLLLIGCGNVANLMLARLHSRQREMAIRTALGASRVTLVRQLLVECLVLAGCGGAVGALVAAVLLRVFVALSPGDLPRLDQAHVDTLTLLFTATCSLAAGLLFGLAPAARSQATGVSSVLAEGARGSSMGLRGNRLRSTLIVAEYAMALVLLMGGGLLLRSFEKLSSVPPGFDPNHTLTFSVALPPNGYQRTTDVNRFVTALLDSIRRLPSVSYAAGGTNLPVSTTEYTVISRPDAPPASAGFKPVALYTVSPDYPRALGITLKRGRSLQSSDRESSLPVALVNEAMARQYWSDTDIVGRQIQWLGGGPRNLTVVGVLADVHQDRLDGPILPALYVPLAQSPQPVRDLIFVARTTGPPLGIASGMHQAVANVDRTLPIFALQTGEQGLARSMAQRRFNMFLLAVFAGAALALATLGLYAVTSYLVGQCAREIGIQIALGATSYRIIRTIMARSLILVAAGLGIGTGAAMALTRFMSSLLFGIDATDGVTFASVATLLVAISMLAVLVPALRATRVDPSVSLRYE
ncbi:MAG: ABC transporter permease [Candidatus Solibacter sp.]